MYLIQPLLPLYDNDKKPFPSHDYEEIRLPLAELFGGVTAFIRSPAVGLWKEGDIEVSRDDVQPTKVCELLAESGKESLSKFGAVYSMGIYSVLSSSYLPYQAEFQWPAWRSRGATNCRCKAAFAVG
jgi:hypothetical protein